MYIHNIYIYIYTYYIHIICIYNICMLMTYVYIYSICIYNVIFNRYFIYIFIEYEFANCFLNFQKKNIFEKKIFNFKNILCPYIL